MSKKTTKPTKPTKVEILRISAKQSVVKPDAPIASHLNVSYDTNQTEEVIFMIEEVCDMFGLYCIPLEKAEELGLLDEED